MAAKMDVRLFTGEQEELLVREPFAFLKHGLEHLQPFGSFLAGRPALMKFREVNDVDARRFELRHEARRLQSAGNAVGILLLLAVQKIERVFDVIMAGKKLVASKVQ